MNNDFLFELLCEELPPKALLHLANSLKLQIEERLNKVEIDYDRIEFFATPRRLAIYIHKLAPNTKTQTIDRKGPAKSAAFDKEGNPTPACLGFARSCGVMPDQLQTIRTPQGEWMSYKLEVPGKNVAELLPELIEQALTSLPIPKRMRWGNGDVQFIRPVHYVMMLYGKDIIEATILGVRSGNVTRGHRFLAPTDIKISQANDYLTQLEKAYVLADFAKRRAKIISEAKRLSENVLITSEAFLDEVTNLVEWPVALKGVFEKEFLQLPKEVLISVMEDHQRYFPINDSHSNLRNEFILISNIESKNPASVIHGNERVLRARFSDAAFFYKTDQEISWDIRLNNLQTITYQEKLGSMYDKAQRISQLSAHIAAVIGKNAELAKRAGLLAKADLTTNMVSEFPELQGIMGGYYARHIEKKEVAAAISEHYQPRFSGDVLPNTEIGAVVAVADRIDNLVGSFGLGQIPTGEKDPFGLRRAALGVIRILIENTIKLDLKPLVEFAIAQYQGRLSNANTSINLLEFVTERLRSYYLEQGISADVFAAVAALRIYNPLDFQERINAVMAFKKLNEAENLSTANKRVSNILLKYKEPIAAQTVDPAMFEYAVEGELATLLQSKKAIVSKLAKSGKYEEVLMQLAELHTPIDNFFEQVMVMTEDKKRRENRLLLLNDLRALFLQVADIALLQ